MKTQAEKELIARKISQRAVALLGALDSPEFAELRREHSEIRLPRALRNHIIDLSCDVSQFIP